MVVLSFDPWEILNVEGQKNIKCPGAFMDEYCKSLRKPLRLSIRARAKSMSTRTGFNKEF